MKIKEQLTHIHQLIHTLTRSIAEIETKKNKVNVRLKREKEWLIDKVIDGWQRAYCTDQPEDELRALLIEEMQQALKGEVSEMSTKEIYIREQLNRLTDELIDNIINTSDKEILKEVEEDYDDPSFVANRVREILKKSQTLKEERKC